MLRDPEIYFDSSNHESSIEIDVQGPLICRCTADIDDKSTVPENFALSTRTNVFFRPSSDLSSAKYEDILGYETTQEFLAPSKELFSEQYCPEIMTKLIDFMGIPFSLQEKKLRFMIFHHTRGCGIVNTLENFQDLIVELVAYFQNLMSLSPAVFNGRTCYVRLVVRKIVKLPDQEFQEWRFGRLCHWIEYYNVVKDIPESKVRWRTAALSVLERLRGGSEWVAERCPICLEEAGSGVSELIRLPCSHVYHKGCILTWLKKNQSCPYCGTETPRIRIQRSFTISCKSEK